MEITGLTLRGSNSGFHAVPRSLGGGGGGGGGGCGKANVRSSKNSITVGSSSSTKTARKTHRSSHESKSDYATRTRDARRCDGEEVRCRAEEKYQKPRRQEAKTASEASVSTAKPVRMSRAQEWSMLVEDNHRFQCGGWRDEREYAAEHGAPERWDNGFIKCVRVKKNGYFTYWRNYRECEKKLIHMVKLYEY